MRPRHGGNGETGFGDDEQAAFVELDLHSGHVLFLRAELGRRGNEIRRRPGERIGAAESPGDDASTAPSAPSTTAEDTCDESCMSSSSACAASIGVRRYQAQVVRKTGIR